MEFVIILLLILTNGVLAMSEISIVSARKARLQQQAEEGSAGARAALEIANNPNRFLSTVQVGITLIGVLQGAFAGTALADDVGMTLARILALAPYSQELGFALIVLMTTYLSLIFGELVPKRLGIQNPEPIAKLMAAPMRLLSMITYPLVWFLSISTDLTIKLLGIQPREDSAVTEEEINVMLREGAEAGVFEKSEQEMVAGVFRLTDLQAAALMTPRTEMLWLEVNDTPEKMREKLIESDFSRYPVCEGTLDHVLGIITAKDLLAQLMSGKPLNLREIMMPAQFIPETATAPDVLEILRGSRSQVVLVIGEYGGVEGIITVNDVIEAIIGTLNDEPDAVQRDDGSWLVDGLISVADFKELIGVKDALPGEEERLYQTLAGFIMMQQGKIPRVADHFEWNGFYLEVVDMDGNRVDRVLVQKARPAHAHGGSQEITPIRDDEKSV